jgi:hypothetical protein
MPIPVLLMRCETLTAWTAENRDRVDCAEG